MNGFLDWIIDRGNPPKPQDQLEQEAEEEKLVDKKCKEEIVNDDPKKTRKKYPVIIPYIKGFSEQLRRTFRKYEVQAYFKPSNTL